MPAMRVAAAVIKLLFGGLIVSCANGADPEVAQRAQRDMIGLPKQQLLACAGNPDHLATHNDKEYLTYRRRASGAVDPSASMGVGGRSSTSVALGIELDTPLVAGGGGGCVATIVLGGGVVEQVAYPAGAWLSECAPIVRNCVEVPYGGQ